MAKKKLKGEGRSSVSSVSSVSASAALGELAGLVARLVGQGGLDARFAEKLAGKIRDEAESSGCFELTEAADVSLPVQLAEMDAAVTGRKVSGLLAAMAQLGAADAAGGVTTG